MPKPLYPLLPDAVQSHRTDNLNGLDMHWLEAGDPKASVLLLLHGFPELSFSWRKIMVPLAEAGFRVIAPDQRGYGHTTGWDGDYDGDLAACRMTNLATDAVGLLQALDVGQVAAVVGHDFGSPVAAHCALLRPDIFRSVVLMSAPYDGPPSLGRPSGRGDVHADLAVLERPRKHYQWFYSTRQAEADMLDAPQGLHDFFRAYYHMKSADWPGNRPLPLEAWSAEELARLPDYYVMDLNKGMAETVAAEMPSAAHVDACAWLGRAEMEVYAATFAQTGFQCALNWYRCQTDPAQGAMMRVFSGAQITVPGTFIAGAQDWGIQQKPGALDSMATGAFADWRGTHLIEGAGHWVQQEQPDETARLIRNFLEDQ
jgi:pimeloyl-ACP methyl ester carboxylesterase